MKGLGHISVKGHELCNIKTSRYLSGVNVQAAPPVTDKHTHSLLHLQRLFPAHATLPITLF